MRLLSSPLTVPVYKLCLLPTPPLSSFTTTVVVRRHRFIPPAVAVHLLPIILSPSDSATVFFQNNPRRLSPPCSFTITVANGRSDEIIEVASEERERSLSCRYFGYSDSKDLVRWICNTRIGDCWLKANIARFTLEEGEIRPDKSSSSRQNVNNINMDQKKGEMPPTRNPTTFFNGSRSFTDTLTGKSGSVGCEKSIVIKSEVDAFRDWHGKALVARMIDLDALKSIHLILNDICPGMGKVQYLGGLSVLISFDDEKTALYVLEAAREVIGRFSKLDVWMGQSFGFERLAWLKLTGFPLQLISCEVIDMVGSSFV
ncbi:hypothetical protein L1987_13602 [Smallanthus sonchifolius]|uniref:Uncharacterized protein n=1 Tax=Smallanthus sonchifolius TaxID=185202 RepID=A0ACB9JHT7_9ASTR|nr:hypothetical protein L1987_13602 [Smallanthus sonchifolius]